MMISRGGGHDFFLLDLRGGLSKFPPNEKEGIKGGASKKKGPFLTGLEDCIECKGLFTWREGHPASRATLRELSFHTFLVKTHWSVNMSDRVTHLPGSPCLFARVTLLGGLSFFPCIKWLCQGHPANWAKSLRVFLVKYEPNADKMYKFRTQTVPFNRN